MIFLLVALAVVLHVAFWGTGLAVLMMPARWRRFWPVLVFPTGFALQSAVVWGAAVSGIPGTNTYAWPSLLLPAGLLALAGWHRGVGRLRAEAGRFSGVWCATAVSLVLLVLPLGVGLRGLTTVSLGSCDAADYAAGARLLMEFSRGDRLGFLGLTEVVQVHSADNFFDYWLRLNHFTPAALIALNGTIVDCAPHELTTLLTLVLLAGSVPVVFWVARSTIGLPARVAVFAAVLYGVSPVTWYAVAQVAPGQLLAAQSIALLTWSGVALWRNRQRSGLGWEFAGVLSVGFWLVLGSYNFILLVCLVPAVAYAGGCAFARREWRDFGRWAVVMLAPLIGCVVVFFGRAAGLVERFTLLRTYDFGWPIPPLTPEGWLGFVGRAPTLDGMGAGWRIFLSLVFAAAVVVAMARRRRFRWVIVSVSVPALFGYAYLQYRGAALATNASYDAYKLLAVFFPGILAASLVWLPGRVASGPGFRIAAGTLAAFVALAHLRAVSQSYHALKSPPLRVSLDLRDVRKIEAMADVSSVNLLIPDMWSRLWANALLLRKPQYFATHTYEARRNTPLRGEWDLLGGVVTVKLPENRSRDVNAHYTLVHRANPFHVRAAPGAGWYPEEVAPDGGVRWQWSAQDAELQVENPQPHPLRATVAVDVQSVGDRDLLAAAGSFRSRPVRLLADQRVTVEFGPLELPPGRSSISLHSPQPAVRVGGDPRPLAWSAHRIEVRVIGR